MIIVFGVLLWSGSDSKKSLYDRYLISFKGFETEVSDTTLVEYYLKEFLELKLANNQQVKRTSSLTFAIPSKDTFTIKQAPKGFDNADLRPINIQVRVKNGIKQLHEKFQTKIAQDVKLKDHLRVSPIKKTSRQIEFIIFGPEKINFIYSQKVLF